MLRARSRTHESRCAVMAPPGATTVVRVMKSKTGLVANGGGGGGNLELGVSRRSISVKPGEKTRALLSECCPQSEPAATPLLSELPLQDCPRWSPQSVVLCDESPASNAALPARGQPGWKSGKQNPVPWGSHLPSAGAGRGVRVTQAAGTGDDSPKSHQKTVKGGWKRI